MRVDLRELTVTYSEGDHALLALDGVDLTLSPGRVTALVGESGSGKTTLGMAMMGLLPENARPEGSIRLNGRELIGLSEKALNELRWSGVAMVFQNGAANLNPVYRVIDQVAEPLIQKLGMDRKSAVREAQESLVRMGLEPEEARRYPHQLSGGQAQRALLAMSVILDPEVLVLDEPTSALDARTKMFIAGVIRELRERRKAILLITHDLGLAKDAADDLAVLYLGRIMELMPARDLLDRPRHPYTWALARSYPGMDAVRDLGGIRGDAFFRLVHAHSPGRGADHVHVHVDAPGAVHQDGHAPPDGCLFQPRCTQSINECRSGEVSLIRTGDHQVRCLRGGMVDLLELRGVEKTFGGVKALRPTDLSLQAGEVFCLVGETGSGKTTLAMIAAAALDPDKGSRTFEGRDMDDWIRREYQTLAPKIGLIHQNPAEAVSHRFTVFDIVAEPLRIQDGRRTKDQVRRLVLQALSDVHLSTSREFLGRYPHELNMGAVQRLCMARALVHDPVLLVADEPTSSLDPSVQAKVLRMLLELQIEKGLTMLFVTHDIGLARKIGDRIGVMLAGEIVEAGPAARILEKPQHPYTGLLIAGAKGLSEPNQGGEDYERAYQS